MPTLFDTLDMGSLTLANRMIMAPMTRNRAGDGDMPTTLMAEYYGQRAGAGLIISEATQISQQGKGYAATPGIYSEEQIAGWRDVTKAVHVNDGLIFAQLWHVGRISHTSLQPDGQQPVAPSAIRADAQVFVGEMVDVSEPKALDKESITHIINDFAYAASCARQAGFDGVEIHAANGYLIDQFLRDGSNTRDDAYGGSAINRARFLFEIIEAVARVMPYEQIGVRLSPTGSFNDMHDSNVEETFSTVIKGLNQYQLAYLHMVEQFPGEEVSAEDKALLHRLRGLWHGLYIANGGFDKASGTDYLAQGRADAIAYGRPYIANPDLVLRYKHDAPLNDADEETFYGGGAEGYTDYPLVNEASKAA